jgi:hypothetical protein
VTPSKGSEHTLSPEEMIDRTITTDLVLAARPLSELLTPIALDPITESDDGSFLEHIADEMNLPARIKEGLPDLY